MKRLYKPIDERVQPVIGYHGTSNTFLRKILKMGIVPDPKRKMWDVDPQASANQLSRASLSGSYWTTNLMTAISSSTSTARKFNGDPLIVMASLVPESAFADEDNVLGQLTRSIEHAFQEEGYSNISRSLSALASWYVQQKYNSNLIYDTAKQVGEQLHRLLEIREATPIPVELLAESLYAYTARQSVFLMDRADYMMKSSWKESYNYSLSKVHEPEMEWEDVPLPEDIFGSKSEVERELKKVVEELTKYYRQVATKTRTSPWTNMRITEPVTYSGRNRIIAIIQRVGKQDYHNVWQLVYGSIPSDFLKQYEERVGELIWEEE